MNGSLGGTSRLSVLTAAILAVSMIGLPSLELGGISLDLEASGKASALPAEYVFNVGVVEYGTTVATLNPFVYTMTVESLTIWPCYSSLLMYDQDGSRFIGDLAESWDVTPDGLNWHFKLYEGVHFVDPSDPDNPVATYEVTADDVEYTFWEIQNDTSNHLHSYFPEVGDPSAPLIVSMTSVGSYDLYVQTYVPFAPFMGAMASIPIIPKYYWSGNDTMKFDNLPVIGSGPFYYALLTLPEQVGILKRNPFWHHEETRGWQVHVEEIRYKSYTSELAAWTALTSTNEIDVMLNVPAATYLEDLPTQPESKKLLGHALATGFVYEFNSNQLTEELREELGAPYNAGQYYNNQLLLDPVVKQAMAISMNKQYFVDSILQGLGSIADSLVPSANPWHYTYGSRPGEIPYSFSTTAARELLMDAGWAFDENGYDADASTVPLYKYDEVAGEAVDPLEFRFYTLNTGQEWQEAGQKVVTWFGEAGIKLNLELLSTNQMNNAWYTANYDTWLWDWVFGPTSDPSTDILSVMTSMELKGWTDCFWSNESFDALYNRSILSVDPDARREIVDEMQRVIYRDANTQPIAYREDLYVATELRWTNYGNWSRNYMLLPDSALPWLYMRISPTGIGAGNEAPRVQVDPSFDGLVGSMTSVSATISDDTSSLEYRWFWGDGESTEWISGSSGMADHTYGSDGYYTAYVAAREVGGDGFISWNQTLMTISDMSNTAPHAVDPDYTDNPITFSPSSPDTGDEIGFVSHFEDDEDDPLYYTWNFGDTYTATGAVVAHQYTVAGIYTVNLSVTDNRLGSGQRPVNVSVLVNVQENARPFLSVPDFGNVLWKQPMNFSIEAYDDDALRYVWDWGDGAQSVTSDPWAFHTYSQKGEYTLTVHADDLTGLPNHNVSDTGTVRVKSSNTGPVIDSYSVSTSSAYTGEMITFSGTAHDGEGDPLMFEFSFGDDTFEVVTGETTLPDEPVSFSVEKSYDEDGAYSTLLYVSDGIIIESSSIETISIIPNDPPIVDALSDKTGTAGISLSFTASALDPDGDEMTYWWDFGDATQVVSGQSASHAYSERGDYTFTVHVDDGHFHNVSASAVAHITAVPTVIPLEDIRVKEGVTWTFTAAASDADGDELSYTWDFGDASPLETGQSVTHAYPVIGADTTYTYALWVDDMSPLPGHNVSVSATAFVLEGSQNYEPTVGDLQEMQGVVDVEIEFSVSASDPDGDPLMYTWYLGDGTIVTGCPVYHTYTSTGDFTVTVYVDDGIDPSHNISRSTTVVILGDSAPVADAGPDQVVDEDTLVAFFGGDSYDDVGISLYSWTISGYRTGLYESLDGVSPTYLFEDPDVYTVELTVTDTIGQVSSPDTMLVTVLDVTSPVANAGADQTVILGDSVDLDGSASSDNVDVVNYTWAVIDVETVLLYGESASYVFTVPGEYTVRLFVYDEAGNSDFDEAVINVVDETSPIADAGPDQNITVGDTVTLNGSGSSDNHEIANYTWSFEFDGQQVELYGPVRMFVFDVEGDYPITLRVMDAAGLADEDTLVVHVNPPNEAPMADAGPDLTIGVGSIVVFDGTGSSDDVLVVNYTWNLTCEGVEVFLYEASPTFTFEMAGEYVVTLTVSDAEGLTDQDMIVITVVTAESPEAEAGANRTVWVGTEVAFDGSASSDDIGIENYTWTFTYDGDLVTLYGVNPKFTFELAGEYTVTLTVVDGDGNSASDTLTVTVKSDDEGKSWIESNGVLLGALLAAVIAAMAAFFVMKGRKGGKEGSTAEPEGISSGEPEELTPPPEEQQDS